LGDGSSKQWKLYNWLNIVYIFKKIWLTFHLKNAKTFRSTQYMWPSYLTQNILHVWPP
jgi:hypothetical protein